MQVSVTFRNMESKEPLREYVFEKIAKLKKYLEVPLEANVVLSAEKHRQIADVTLSGNRMTIMAQDENAEILIAIDRVMEKLERQILKHKEKGRHHKSNSPGAETSWRTETVPTERGAGRMERKILKTKKINLPLMSIEEAATQLENLEYHFLLFQNVTSKDLNILYRLRDGNYGLLIPQMG